jgi:hypothetical protein
MGSAISIDHTEAEICDIKQAQVALARLPASHQQLKHWHIWAENIFQNVPWYDHLAQSMTIAYARMAVRNGSLNPKPRSYHNEIHINDLLLRVMYCAKHYEQQLSPNGLAILSYFAACHDLRQDEAKNENNPLSLVGSNEKVSFEEAARIIDSLGPSTLWSEHHLLLLKTMIEGSTFGSGGKRSKNFFQGNLAKHLLKQLSLPNKNDEQLVLLACDLDTANVSLPIGEFAQSAVHIYDELISHQQAAISAHQFFSQQQKIYFFEQQCFNANITQDLFAAHKQQNSDKLKILSEFIENMPSDLADAEIKTAFLNKAEELETS